MAFVPSISGPPCLSATSLPPATVPPPPCCLCGGYTGGIELVGGVRPVCGACATCAVCGVGVQLLLGAHPEHKDTPSAPGVFVIGFASYGPRDSATVPRVIAARPLLFVPEFQTYVHPACASCDVCKGPAVSWRIREKNDPPGTAQVVAVVGSAVLRVQDSKCIVRCSLCARVCACDDPACTVPPVTHPSNWYHHADGTHVYLPHRPCYDCGLACGRMDENTLASPPPTARCRFCKKCIHHLPQHGGTSAANVMTQAGERDTVCVDCLRCAVCDKTRAPSASIHALASAWCITLEGKTVHRKCLACPVCNATAPLKTLCWTRVPSHPKFKRYAPVHTECKDKLPLYKPEDLRDPPDKKRKRKAE